MKAEPSILDKISRFGYVVVMTEIEALKKRVSVLERRMVELSDSNRAAVRQFADLLLKLSPPIVLTTQQRQALERAATAGAQSPEPWINEQNPGANYG